MKSKEEMVPRMTLGDLLRYMLAYICWALSAVLGMLAFWKIRSAINVLWPVFGGNRWAMGAIDRLAMLFLGIALLVYILAAEHLYRSSITIAREARLRAEQGLPVQANRAQESQVLQRLREWGLDVLIRRLVPLVGIPLALYVLAYLLQELAFASLR